MIFSKEYIIFGPEANFSRHPMVFFTEIKNMNIIISTPLKEKYETIIRRMKYYG